MEEPDHIQLIGQLFRTCHAGLVAYAHTIVRSPEDARELVQEVFLSVWKNRDRLDWENNPKAYLFAATRNKCLNFLQKRRLPPLATDPSLLMHAPVDPEVEAEMEAAELRAEIFDEVRRLPEKCRAIFLLSRRDQLSHKEIAERLNLSEKTVENQIGIALKRIRRRLYPDPGDDGPATPFSDPAILLIPVLLERLLALSANVAFTGPWIKKVEKMPVWLEGWRLKTGVCLRDLVSTCARKKSTY